ncbi:hypothetical protein [Hamadaea tsunoensis]|uniref:hypothetical protein n=1 Tax=Hamadaea tsunoensis TaxID=53368 RepID=UPI0004212EFF|nr:hypothetical protein [Hamadaea tsunoensis]
MQTPNHRAGRPRRDLLRGLAAIGAAGVLAGCDLLGDPEPPAPDPLLGFLGQTRALLAAYEATIAAVPDLAGRLQPIRETHAAHVTALTEIIKPPSGTPVPSSSTPATLAGLKTAEAAAQKSAYATALSVPAGRATLLGEIAAARSTHLAVL